MRPAVGTAEEENRRTPMTSEGAKDDMISDNMIGTRTVEGRGRCDMGERECKEASINFPGQCSRAWEAFDRATVPPMDIVMVGPS